MKLTLRPFATAVLAFGLIIPLTSCGSDSPSDTESNAGAPTESSSANTETDTEDKAPGNATNPLATMSVDELEAKLKSVTIDGESLSPFFSPEEMKEMQESMSQAIEEAANTMMVEPAECMALAQESQKFQSLPNIEHIVSVMSENGDHSVLVAKVTNAEDLSSGVNDAVTYASECPELSLEIPSLGTTTHMSQTATEFVAAPFPEGVIVTQDQTIEPMNQSTHSHSFYGVDPATGVYIFISIPATQYSVDEAKTLITDVLNQLTS